MGDVRKSALHLIKAYKEVDQGIIHLDRYDPERDKLLELSCELIEVAERLEERSKHER